MNWIEIETSQDLVALYKYISNGFDVNDFHSRVIPIMYLKHMIRYHLRVNHLKTLLAITKLEQQTFGGKTDHSKISNSIKNHNKLIKINKQYQIVYNKLLLYNKLDVINDKDFNFIIELQILSVKNAHRLLFTYFTPKEIFKERL